MYQLLYVSHARPDLDMKGLRKILETARAVNAEHDITGVLLLVEGKFLQVLEGERRDVEKIYFKIEADGRHSDVEILLSQEIAGRDYGDWRMGFDHLSSEDAEAADIFQIAGATASKAAPPGAAPKLLTLLRDFYATHGGRIDRVA